MDTTQLECFIPLAGKHYSSPVVQIQAFPITDVILTSLETGGEWPWQDELVNFG